MRYLIFSAVFAFFSSLAFGAPEEFRTAFGAQDAANFARSGSEAGKVTFSPGQFDSPEGELSGLAIKVSGAASNAREAQLVAPVPNATKAGETLWVRFWLRTTASEQESGEGMLQVVFENSTSFEKSALFPASTGRAWKEITYPFTARESLADNAAHLCLRLGYQRQDLEIAGLEIRNYGSAVKPADLPMTKPEFHYDGMAADAPWRPEAEQRIDKIRKAPLTVKVVDASGQPVADATVEISQTRHEYLFGSAVTAEKLTAENDAEARTYRDVVSKEFNAVTFENDLKWARWAKDRETPLAAARWCAEQGIVLRGHTMVWPSWRKLPPALQELSSQPEELRAAVMKHIEDIGEAVGPLAQIWDVLNEPFANHDLMDLFGNHFMVDCFEAARKAAPSAQLFINDFGIVTDRGLDHVHQDHYDKTISYLIEQGAPLQGIGIQGHFGQELTAPKRILEILDRFGRFQKPIQLTEFSLQIEDRTMDAAYLRDVMTVIFSHPSTDGFLLWGFRNGPGEFPHSATLFDKDWNLTPCGQVWHDLVFNRWWTRETRQTAETGEVQVRGFRGRYQITVRHGDVTVQQSAQLGPEGAELTLVLKNN